MLKPINENVIVEPKKDDEKTLSGIYLPPGRSPNERNYQGTVVAVGPGKLNKKTGEFSNLVVKVGDKVLYNWGGTDVEYEGKKYRILQESDILAIME